jgi:xylan 1,4-beta-xylosidase
VQGPDNKYYGVFLGIRPNEKDRVNIGRETFILPVDWSGEFPVFEDGLVPMEPKLKMPVGVQNKSGSEGFLPTGNFTYTENFLSERLDYRWIGLRGPRETFISQTKNGLRINPFETNITALKPTSTLFYRQQHSNFSFTTTMQYKPDTEKDLSGIVCLQSEAFNYVFGITRKGNDYILLLQRNEKKDRRSAEVCSTIIATAKIDIKTAIRLKVEANGDDYRFSYAIGESDFSSIGGTVSGDILSTNVAGGFTGCLLGLYATSANDISIQ